MDKKRTGSTKLRDIEREARATPPSRSHIDALPALGSRQFTLDLSGLSIRLRGLDEELAGAVAGRFGAFSGASREDAGALTADVHADSAAEYVTPERSRPEGYYRLRIVHEEGLVRLVTYSMAAWIDVQALRAGIAFGSASYDPRERALENFCRVATAWLAVSRGGFFIHGASIVRGGRAYVFFGKSAAGKSTLASMSREGRVISDDLTLVLPGASGLEVAGSPFRGTYQAGEPVVGRFPLAALFRIHQDTRTFVDRPKRVVAMAEAIANLPFVNEAFHLRPDLLDKAEKALSSVPLLALHFEKNPGYWTAVDAALEGLG